MSNCMTDTISSGPGVNNRCQAVAVGSLDYTFFARTGLHQVEAELIGVSRGQHTICS